MQLEERLLWLCITLIATYTGIFLERNVFESLRPHVDRAMNEDNCASRCFELARSVSSSSSQACFRASRHRIHRRKRRRPRRAAPQAPTREEITRRGSGRPAASTLDVVRSQFECTRLRSAARAKSYMPGWVNTADPLILIIAPATAMPMLGVFIGDKGGR